MFTLLIIKWSTRTYCESVLFYVDNHDLLKGVIFLREILCRRDKPLLCQQFVMYSFAAEINIVDLVIGAGSEDVA